MACRVSLVQVGKASLYLCNTWSIASLTETMLTVSIAMMTFCIPGLGCKVTKSEVAVDADDHKHMSTWLATASLLVHEGTTAHCMTTAAS